MLSEDAKALLLSAGSLLTREAARLGVTYLLLMDDGRGGQESISNLASIEERRGVAALYALRAQFVRQVDLGGES